mgnify:FL=1
MLATTALDTLNLKGGASATTASGNLDLIKSAADTTTAVTTLNVNSAGGFIGSLGVAGNSTQAAGFTAVNIASAADTTFANAALAGNKTLTVSGSGVTTFTALTAANNAALTSIVSTGGGLKIGTELANNVSFTGGAGNDEIAVGATTKAINMGAGNDVVTVSTTVLGAGGSINGGDGIDTLVANVNGSAFVGLPGFSGFEVLRVAGAAALGTHNAVGFTALEVGAVAGNTTFTNVAAGIGLTQLASFGGGSDVVVTLADATGTNDTFNLTLKSAGAIGAAGETITINGVENINITSTDTDTTAHQNTVALIADAAKSIVVSGNAGVAFVNAPATVTSFDATGVVVGKATDNGVTFTSTNATVAENVSIKGSNGVDILSGSATANDTIYGGAGNDTLIYTGGTDFLYGEAGNDTFDVNAVGTKTSYLTIGDAVKDDKIDLAGASVGTIQNGALGAKVTLGAAATFDQYLDEAAKTIIVDLDDADADGNVATGIDAVVKWFQFGGDTFVVVDNSIATSFQSGTDSVIKLTGLLDLSTSAFAGEVLTIA